LRLLINGQVHDVSISLSNLKELLSYLNLTSEGRIIELNDSIYLEESFSSSFLKEGDKIEIIQFMGGGNYVNL